MSKRHVLTKYYLATPLFLVIDLLLDQNYRVAIPWGADSLAYIYMILCFIVGGLILKNSSLLNVFTLIESSLNIFLLILSVYLSIFALAGRPEQSGAFRFGTQELIHFAVVGSMFLYSFYSNKLIKKGPIER